MTVSEDPNSLSLEHVALRVQGTVAQSWGAEQNIQQDCMFHTSHTSATTQMILIPIHIF